MTEHRPYSTVRLDYIPAAGRDALLPAYDLLTRVVGMGVVYRQLIAQAELGDGMCVLEIGCGTGNLTTRAKRAYPGVDITGSDPDPKALARARRKAQGLTGIRFDHAYAQELPYGDGEFDRALSSMMLHHLDGDVKAKTAAELHRVLRPGGTLHIVDIGGNTSAHDGMAARWMKNSPHATGNLGDAIPRLLRSVGFDAAEVGTHRNRFIGRLTFYRATRPA